MRILIMKNRRITVSIVANELDWGIWINGFELQSPYYVHIRTITFEKGMIAHPPPLFLRAISLIVSQLFFHKNGFGNK